jgi:NADPH oxidase
MYQLQNEVENNYINLDEISIFDYDIKFNNINKYLFAFEWCLYTFLSQPLNYFTKIYHIKLGDFIIIFPIIIFIISFSLYFLITLNIKYTGIFSQICLFITLLTALKKINILPFDKLIYYHKMFSILTLFISLLHGIVGIYIPRNNIINYKIITGYIFYILLLIINLFSISKFKDRFYHVFVNIHKIIFLLIFIIAMMHGNGLVICPVIVYLIDLIYRIYLVKKINNLKLDIKYEIVSHDLIKIEIIDNKVYCNSGQYIYINIPQISLLEWHPYSIANAPNENKICYINVIGDWTNKLKDKIKKNEKLDILIDGFYGNISKFLLEYQYIILFSGGIGITPILSILRHIYYNYKNNLQHIKKIYFICSFKDYNSIVNLLDPIYFEYREIFDKENIFQISLFNTYIHITNNKNKNMDLNDLCKFKYCVKESRPNISDYLNDFNSLAYNNSIKKIGIFASGPENMINEVIEYASILGKNTKIRQDIYTENYKY